MRAYSTLGPAGAVSSARMAMPSLREGLKQIMARTAWELAWPLWMVDVWRDCERLGHDLKNPSTVSDAQ